VSVLETDRLTLRRITVDDAEFILELLNEPSFLRFIGDKGVRTLADARNYILNGPINSYEQFGFGLYLTELKDSAMPIGMCGLLKRETLDHVDIGFAFRPEFWGRGYGLEAAKATLIHGRDVFGLKRILAITSPDNHGSIGLLEKLGFRFERLMKLTEDTPPVKLLGIDHGLAELRLVSKV